MNDQLNYITRLDLTTSTGKPATAHIWMRSRQGIYEAVVNDDAGREIDRMLSNSLNTLFGAMVYGPYRVAGFEDREDDGRPVIVDQMYDMSESLTHWRDAFEGSDLSKLEAAQIYLNHLANQLQERNTQ